MDDIDALRRQEIELLKQIDAAGNEKAELLKQRDALLSRKLQTDAQRLIMIYGMCLGILKQAGHDIDSTKALTEFDKAVADLSKRTRKDLAASVVAEIRKAL